MSNNLRLLVSRTTSRVLRPTAASEVCTPLGLVMVLLRTQMPPPAAQPDLQKSCFPVAQVFDTQAHQAF
eukprot:6270589-Amphidinium_carterae.1